MAPACGQNADPRVYLRTTKGQREPLATAGQGKEDTAFLTTAQIKTEPIKPDSENMFLAKYSTKFFIDESKGIKTKKKSMLGKILS